MALRAPCGGGQQLPTLCSATSELWGNTAPYVIGQMVRDRANPTDPWVLYVATGRPRRG